MNSAEDPEAFPSPAIATALTLAALMVMLLVVAPFFTAGHIVAGLAAGTVVGFGGVGSLAARRVPAPADQHLGLCGVPLKRLLIVLMLVPLVLWLSELENIVALWLERPEPTPPPEPGSNGISEGLRSLEIALFVVLLRPVVEEFFFRGVIQQGVVAHLGPGWGVLLSTLLFSLSRGLTGPTSEYGAVVVVLQMLVLGGVLGALRLATGSLLPGILLQGLMNSIEILALSVAEDFPIQGFTTLDSHTHPALLLPAALLIAWAIAKMRHLNNSTSGDGVYN
ncbi:MAG: CPBP family intramembrane metalloprotease [bacterium]|nr:CPBP family intramembrane metalloprotease [bacterium]